MSSTTTINIQNTHAEACNNVMDDYVDVGLSVGGGGGREQHIFIGAKWPIQHYTGSHVIYMGRDETMHQFL